MGPVQVVSLAFAICQCLARRAAAAARLRKVRVDQIGSVACWLYLGCWGRASRDGFVNHSLLDASRAGELRKRREGPFKLTVAALAGPNTNTLTLPRHFKRSSTVNVDWLRPYHSSAPQNTPPNPGPMAVRARSCRGGAGGRQIPLRALPREPPQWPDYAAPCPASARLGGGGGGPPPVLDSKINRIHL